MGLRDASCLLCEKLLCLIKKGDPGAVNASAVFANFHSWAVSGCSLNYHRSTTEKRVIFFFLRIALYYILLWADNLFKGWQIVLSVWGNSLQPRFSCSCHGFPLLSIWSVSNHKMSHQTTAQRVCLKFEWPGWEILSCCLHLIHRFS